MDAGAGTWFTKRHRAASPLASGRRFATLGQQPDDCNSSNRFFTSTMPTAPSASPVRIAIIGAGAVSDYHHVPAIRLDPRAKLTGVCDASRELLEKRRTDWSCDNLTTDFEAICADPSVDAVIIATPN